MSNLQKSPGYQIIQKWMQKKGFGSFPFQEQTWAKFENGYSGMVIAPTGFGKTFSVFLAIVINYLNYPEEYGPGLKLIWISPLRSLAKDDRIGLGSRNPEWRYSPKYKTATNPKNARGSDRYPRNLALDVGHEKQLQIFQ